MAVFVFFLVFVLVSGAKTVLEGTVLIFPNGVTHTDLCVFCLTICLLDLVGSSFSFDHV